MDKKVDYKYRVKMTPKAEKFLDSLVDDQKLSLIGLIGMLRKLGYELEYPYCKKVHTKKNRIYELRCNKFGNRLYYFFHEENIYIATNGGGKSTQPKDIKQADKMASDIKSKL